jgi:hypothetical protein
MAEADDLLRAYQQQMSGSKPPHDALEQATLTLLRQWCRHLEVVLTEAQLSPHMRRDILRQMIYGAFPHETEAVARDEIRTGFHEHLERCTGLPVYGDISKCDWTHNHQEHMWYVQGTPLRCPGSP